MSDRSVAALGRPQRLRGDSTLQRSNGRGEAWNLWKHLAIPGGKRVGSEGQRRAGRPCGPSLGRWAPQHCSPRSGAPSQGCPRSAPGPWDGVQRAPHMSAAAQLPALQTHQRHNWGGRLCTPSPWKELTRVPGRRPRRTARGSPYTPLSEKPAQAKGVMQRAFKILHKNTAAFQKLPPSHPGYPLARSGLWRCLCGEVWLLPAVMTQMPLDLCLSREYHLKVSLIFFFLKNMISGERKEETTMVKLVALRTKFASVYLKPHM